jgi:hypothetical protein
MKNQYFGDIQDYRKYGLLRQLTGHGQMRLGVIWMLTPDDTRTDGNKTEYLNQPERYRKADPELFDALRSCVLEDGQRDVSQAQSFLPNATFFSRLIPDVLETRKRTVRDAQQAVIDTELVFFDPDNGIEISSCAKGKRNSSKFVYWDEVYNTFQNGHSVLVYQHFPRVAREEYVQQRLEEFSSRLRDTRVMAFCTPHVGFFLCVQSSHIQEIQAQLPTLALQWQGELTVSTLQGKQ